MPNREALNPLPFALKLPRSATKRYFEKTARYAMVFIFDLIPEFPGSLQMHISNIQ